MLRLATALTGIVILLSNNVARAGDSLDVIPENAAGAIVVRNPKELGKKGDRFIAETDIKMPLRPSQLVDQLYTFLGITTGLDAEGAAFLTTISDAYRTLPAIVRSSTSSTVDNPFDDLRASAVARFSSAFRVAPPKLGGLSLMTAYAACRCSRSPSRNFSGMPIKRRSWSRPRDRRERTVPTGTLRIAATSS